MKKLEIVFTKSKKRFPIFSWLIMLWTDKPYSHIARAIEIKDWGKRYFQASEGSVNYEYEKYFSEKHEIVKKYVLEIPRELDTSIKRACYEEAGNKYGTAQNIGIVYVDIMHRLFNKDVKNPFKKGRNCSELLYITVFKKMYPKLLKSPEIIKPHDLENILIKHGHKAV